MRCGSPSSAAGASGRCTPTCSPRVSPAPRSPRSTTPCPRSAGRLASAHGVAVAPTLEDAISGRRRRRHLHEHRHPRRADHARRRAGLADVLREADLARPGDGRRHAGRRRQGRDVSAGRLQPPLRPGPRGGPRGRRRRLARDAVPRQDHQPRPPAATGHLPRPLGRDVPRHDDPRLRHGQVHRRAATSSRSTPPSAPPSSTRRSARSATSTRPWSCCATPPAA